MEEGTLRYRNLNFTGGKGDTWVVSAQKYFTEGKRDCMEEAARDEGEERRRDALVWARVPPCVQLPYTDHLPRHSRAAPEQHKALPLSQFLVFHNPE